MPEEENDSDYSPVKNNDKIWDEEEKSVIQDFEDQVSEQEEEAESEVEPHEEPENESSMAMSDIITRRK